jgi:hypothetical protein
MLSRALSLATVTLLIGCLAATPVRAQNLEAGKSPSQIFSGTCAACHKAPRGLLKTVSPGSLPGFLRQHYTTSSEMASMLAGFLVANGATDTRQVGTRPTQQPKDAKPEQLDRFGRPMRPAAASQEAARPESQPQQAARPDADGLTPQGEPGRPGRNAKRQPRPGDTPDAKPADGQAPAQAAIEPGPDGRKAGTKQKLSRRGKPEEAVKPEVAKPESAKPEPATSEPAKDESAKDETAKEEGGNPSDEGKSESAKVDAPKDTGGESPPLRADPVPPVTPAPPAAPAPSTTATSGTQEPAVSAPAPAAQPAPPAVTASVPPPAVAPAGPPAPPISQ